MRYLMFILLLPTIGYSQRLHVDSAGVHIIFTLNESRELIRWSAELEDMTNLAAKQQRMIELLERDVKLCDEQKSLVVVQRDTVIKEVEVADKVSEIHSLERKKVEKEKYDLVITNKNQKKFVFVLGFTNLVLLYLLTKK